MMQDRVLVDAEDRDSEEVQFKLIYGATFIAMVVAGCIAHVLPWRMRSRSRGDNASIIRRAKEKAGHYSAFAFMG